MRALREIIRVKHSYRSNQPSIRFGNLLMTRHTSVKNHDEESDFVTADSIAMEALPRYRRWYKQRSFTSMAAIATAEACDANPSFLASNDLRVLHPTFKIYGQARAFSGPIVTLKVFEDNVMVREFLESKGEGRVLVIDGGGSMRCALVGGNLGQLAQNMGWSGIVVNGCIRDVDEINGCDIGVRALGSHPLKSSKKGHGEKHVPVYVGGVLIRDGEWLYADIDGILVSKSELSV